MALEERQTQIRERAGLDEARLNQDFVDFLRKYGSWLLILAAAAALSVSLWQRYKQSQDTKLGQAFEELEAARSGANPNPDSLISVAQAYDGMTGIAVLARLGAADAWLDAIRRGVKPGASVQPDGSVAPEDLLTDADRTDLLGKASAEYQWVVDRAGGTTGYEVHAIEGLYGLAAVAESKGEWEAAKDALTRIETMANAKGFSAHAKVAKARRENMGSLASIAPAPDRASVPPSLDTAPKPPPTPVSVPESPAGEPVAEPAVIDLSGAASEKPAEAPPEEAPKQPEQQKP